jgi:D-inositol-3-phosphate glycosyltransferase
MFLDSIQPAMRAEGVFGRDLAIDDWVVALLRYGQAPSYRFFQVRDRLRARPIPGHEHVEQLARSRLDTMIKIEDIAVAPRALGLNDPRVWHDPDGDLDAAIAMRGYASRMYPVTATVHILSYRSLRHGWFLRLLLQDVRACDSLICTSYAARTATERLFDDVADRIERTRGLSCRFRGRLDVIPLGVDTTRFRPRDKTEMRRAIGLPEHAFLITWVGRFSLNDKADLVPLVIVFARLVKANPARKLRLVLAGAGTPLTARILRRHAETLGVAEWVHFIDPLSPDQRHLVHAAADVFVSPADNVQETFGLTPLEAMASGVPQVVADWDGYRDTVLHGETGFLVPTWLADTDAEANTWVGAVKGEDFLDHLLVAQATALDLDELEAALQRLVDDDALRARMGDASRRRALDVHAWPHIVARYETLWQELALLADSLPVSSAGCTDYARPSFVSTFGHYATTVLTDDACFRLSEAGRRVLGGGEALPLYLEPTGLWSSDALAEILWFLQRAGQPLTMRELPGVGISKFDDVNGARAAHVARRHVMWLLKYGLVELVRLR